MTGVAGCDSDASLSMIIESATRSSVWPILPSGRISCSVVFAANTVDMKAMNLAASATIRYGVTVGYPSGMALTGMRAPGGLAGSRYSTRAGIHAVDPDPGAVPRDQHLDPGH